ncbi:hypothetical protein F7725_021547 [Dissostichus mawsoni]|uniref:Uncharacterized protein n=1 Tax=Dissostichus mawsoni TaxID=36200 RepID=A0A7J5ZFK8_DISMA|nr:hypothetical protein F7725_021547 [Dissostichus mawsoni]
MQILKIGQVFTIRWVSSSFNTVKAVLKDFPVLAHHFQSASEDGSRSGAEKAKYTGLHKHLTSTGFLSDLATMKDVLRELQSLSLKLQKRDTSLVDASRHIHQTIEVLSAMKDNGGKTELKVTAGITSGQFKGVDMRETQPKIKKSQFYQSIIDNLTRRLPDSELVTMLKPMDQHFWPKDRRELVLFGESEVGKFAKLLGESATEAVSEFRDWKLQGKEHQAIKDHNGLLRAAAKTLYVAQVTVGNLLPSLTLFPLYHVEKPSAINYKSGAGLVSVERSMFLDTFLHALVDIGEVIKGEHPALVTRITVSHPPSAQSTF